MADLIASSARSEQCTARGVSETNDMTNGDGPTVTRLTLDGRETELFCDLGVLDLSGLLEGHALDALRHV